MENAVFHFSLEKEREKPRQQDQQNRPLTWFLFFWLAFIYVQNILAPFEYLLTDAPDPTAGKANPSVSDVLTGYFSYFNSYSLAGSTLGMLFPCLAFTFLMTVQGGLLWLALFKKKSHWRLRWLSLLLQVMCFWLIFSVAGMESVVSGLCVLLAIEVIILLKRIPWSIVGVVGCLLYYGVWQGFTLLHFLQNGHSIQSAAPKLMITAVDALAFLPFACASFLLYLQQTRAHQRDQQLLCELENAHMQLEDYAARVQDLTLTTERQRMARELHDTLAQGLVGLTMQLETINALLGRQRSEQARTIVQQALTRSRATIASARAAITDLRAEAATTDDLLAAIEAEAQHFTLMTGIPCACCLQIKLPGDYHEHLLRFTREGLTNIARHAQASQVWIRADNENEMITFDIEDNGIGFDPAQVPKGHYGLLGLHERARLMNGHLQVDSEPGRGTTVCLCLPGERTYYE